MAKTKSLFEVSAEGLKKQIGNRSKVIIELIQNAWDEESSVVKIGLTKVPDRRSIYRITVEDDNPEGFKDISHAYTLFAESEKKRRPTKRGRFNIGEKLFIAACESVVLTTTTGQVSFSKEGRAHSRKKREAGSIIEADIKLSEDDLHETESLIRSLIPPSHIDTYFNDVKLEIRKPLQTFETILETVIENDEGFLKPSKRKTAVELFEPAPGDPAFIYEMGIPVVEGDCRWHVNICQKVPLNRDRDNISEGFKKKLYAEILNHAHQNLSAADVAESWVKTGSSTPHVTKDAFSAVLDLRFGKNRVSFSPSDREANHRAVAEGATVVHGSNLSKTEWENARSMGLISSAESVYPTAKPYSLDPNAPREKLLPETEWTPAMHDIADYAKTLARHLLDIELDVRINLDVRGFRAAYGGRGLVFFLKALGREWFETASRHDVDALLIHEFGHHFESNHLSESYHEALCSLGAKLIRLALTKPHIFQVEGKHRLSDPP